jgi:hypothetical protein
MSQAHPDWWQSVNAILAEHEERIKMLEQSFSVEQVQPPADDPHYDLRTYDERADARMNNHDGRIRALEHRLLLMEMRLRAMAHAAESADGV